MQRVQRRHLPRSRWTARIALPGGTGERHYEVVEVSAVGRGDDDVVVMRAILTGHRHRVALAALADDEAWAPGWISIPLTSPPAP